jgi:hypothetical protein
MGPVVCESNLTEFLGPRIMQFTSEILGGMGDDIGSKNGFQIYEQSTTR